MNWKSWNLPPVCPGDDRVAPKRESGERRAAEMDCAFSIATFGNVVKMILKTEGVREEYHLHKLEIQERIARRHGGRLREFADAGVDARTTVGLPPHRPRAGHAGPRA